MSDNRNLDSDISTAKYNSLVASINYEYCKKHGYDFIYYNPYLDNKDEINILNCRNPNTQKLRHASWSKLLTTIVALDLSYEYVVYIDSDCIFKDFDKSIEEFIKNESKADIYFLNNKPWGDNIPCAGFFICRVTESSKHMIQWWYNINIDEHFNENHPWEQHALWSCIWLNIQDKWSKLLHSHLNNIVIIDSWMFNEVEGQFLRHVGLCEGDNRIPYFTKFIQEKHIDYNENINNIITIKYDTEKILCDE